MSLYPWHHDRWQKLTAARVPPALLIYGVEGIGKKHFAREWVRYVLCEAVRAKKAFCACTASIDQQCASCQLMAHATHPNCQVIAPEEAGHSIKIDDIRASLAFTQQSSMRSGVRCVLIESAHALTLQAANALLKTLEEPNESLVFVLVADYSYSLPKTLLSRLLLVPLSVPDESVACAWLQHQFQAKKEELQSALRLAGGAPLRALRYLQEDGLSVRQTLLSAVLAVQKHPETLLTHAESLQQHDLLLLLNCLISWASDLLKMKLALSHLHVQNADYYAELATFSTQFSIEQLLAIIKRLMARRKDYLAQVALNKQLLIETLLLDWIIN